MDERSSKRQSIADRVIENGILLLIIFPPLVFGAVHEWSSALMQLISFVVFGAWLVDRKRSAKYTLMGRAVLVPAGLFLIVVLVQCIPFPPKMLDLVSPATAFVYRRFLPHGESGSFPISIVPGHTLAELLRVAAYVSVFTVVINHYRDRRQILALVRSFIGVAVFLVIIAVLQKAAWNGRLYWFYPIDASLDSRLSYIWGPYVNRNHFAGYLELIVPLVLGLMVYEISRLSGSRTTKRRNFIPVLLGRKHSLKISMLLLVAVTLSGAVLATLSRGGILALAASLAVFPILTRASRSLRRSTTILALAGIVIVVLGVTAGWGRIAHRYGEIAEDDLIARPKVWEDAFALVKDNAFLGTGLGSFDVAFPRYQRHFSQTFFEHAENDYLEILTDTGLAGSLAVAAMMLFYFKDVLRQWSSRRNIFSRSISAGGLASLTAIAVHSFVDFNMRIPANAMSVTIIAGITYAVLFNLPRKSRQVPDRAVQSAMPAAEGTA